MRELHRHIERCYGLRCEGQGGWILVQTTVAPDVLRARLRKRGRFIAELRPVRPDRSSREAKPRTFMFRRSTRRDYRLCWFCGWVFDDVIRSFRPPEEPLTFPQRKPVRTRDFTVRFSIPEAGWLPIACSSGARTVEFEASNVYDPIPALVRWLADVAQGANTRFAIDDEHRGIEFHLAPEAGTLVRFAIAIVGEDPVRRFELDVIIARRRLVTAFYRPLRQLWASKALYEKRGQWFDNYDPEFEEERDEDTYSVADPILDRLIDGSP